MKKGKEDFLQAIKELEFSTIIIKPKFAATVWTYNTTILEQIIQLNMNGV